MREIEWRFPHRNRPYGSRDLNGGRIGPPHQLTSSRKPTSNRVKRLGMYGTRDVLGGRLGMGPRKSNATIIFTIGATLNPFARPVLDPFDLENDLVSQNEFDFRDRRPSIDLISLGYFEASRYSTLKTNLNKTIHFTDITTVESPRLTPRQDASLVYATATEIGKVTNRTRYFHQLATALASAYGIGGVPGYIETKIILRGMIYFITSFLDICTKIYSLCTILNIVPKLLTLCNICLGLYIFPSKCLVCMVAKCRTSE